MGDGLWHALPVPEAGLLRGRDISNTETTETTQHREHRDIAIESGRHIRERCHGAGRELVLGRHISQHEEHEGHPSQSTQRHRCIELAMSL